MREEAPVPAAAAPDRPAPQSASHILSLLDDSEDDIKPATSLFGGSDGRKSSRASSPLPEVAAESLWATDEAEVGFRRV